MGLYFLEILKWKIQKTGSKLPLAGSARRRPWHIQSGFIAIPKSTSPAHIKDNFDIFDFELSQEDMLKIAKLDTGKPSFIHNEEFGKQLLSWVVPE